MLRKWDLIGLGICSKKDVEPLRNTENKNRYPYCSRDDRLKILRAEKKQLEDELQELEIG